jgi:hypothetical protein
MGSLLYRLFLLGVVGASLACLGWLTKWPYAISYFGALLCGSGAVDATRADAGRLPYHWSSTRGRQIIGHVGTACILVPVLATLIWFRWWWWLAAFPLGGVAAALFAAAVGLSSPPSKVFSGLLIAACGTIWLLVS